MESLRETGRVTLRKEEMTVWKKLKTSNTQEEEKAKLDGHPQEAIPFFPHPTLQQNQPEFHDVES
jgi:hypothetical protein